jgi:hypothetical protein
MVVAIWLIAVIGFRASHTAALLLMCSILLQRKFVCFGILSANLPRSFCVASA